MYVLITGKELLQIAKQAYQIPSDYTDLYLSKVFFVLQEFFK